MTAWSVSSVKRCLQPIFQISTPRGGSHCIARGQKRFVCRAHGSSTQPGIAESYTTCLRAVSSRPPGKKWENRNRNQLTYRTGQDIKRDGQHLSMVKGKEASIENYRQKERKRKRRQQEAKETMRERTRNPVSLEICDKQGQITDPEEKKKDKERKEWIDRWDGVAAARMGFRLRPRWPPP